jgi:hypothetical protein
LKKIYFGILALLISFSITALYIHNLEYWATVKWWSLNLATVGFLILFFSLTKNHQEQHWYKILFKPGKWYLNILGVLVFILTLTICYMFMDRMAIRTNEKIRAYYIAAKSIETTATVIGTYKVSFTLKSTYKQSFMAIEYSTQEGIMRQGLDIKQYAYLKPGQKITILYVKAHPSFFKLQ